MGEKRGEERRTKAERYHSLLSEIELRVETVSYVFGREISMRGYRRSRTTQVIGA
jgi:hypothetical protein